MKQGSSQRPYSAVSRSAMKARFPSNARTRKVSSHSGCLESAEFTPKGFPALEEDCEPGTPEGFYAEGLRALNKGYFEAAASLYSESLRLYPGHFRSRVNMGVCLMKLGAFKRALETFSEANKHSPGCPLVYYNRALCHISLKEYSTALSEIEIACRFSSSEDFLRLHALIMSRAGHITEVLNPCSVSTSLLSHTALQYKVDSPKIPGRAPSAAKIQSLCAQFEQKPPVMRPCSVQRRRIVRPTEQCNPDVPEPEELLGVLVRRTLERDKRSAEYLEQLAQRTRQEEQGFVQEEARFLLKAEKALFDPLKQEKIEKLKRQLLSENQDSGWKPSVQHFAESTLSAQAVAHLEEEFAKPTNQIDFCAIAETVKSVPFFSKFCAEGRLAILKQCQFHKYPAGITVIKQGELGNSMFVIVSGSVVVLKGPPQLEIVVNSLYDGDTFGEVALLASLDGESLQRTASCVTGETTHLISIGKKEYRQTLMNEMQNDIAGKLAFLQGLKFFQNSNELELIPVASNVELVMFRLNDVLLQKGEVPKGLYILYKGRCTVYWEGYSLKPKRPRTEANAKIRQAQSLGSEEEAARRLFSQMVDPTNPQDLRAVSRFFQRPAQQLLKDSHIYKERIPYMEISEGDYLGGRSLFHAHAVEPAKFTVVANSTTVHVLLIRKQHFSLLSENLVKDMRTVVLSSEDIDCPQQWTQEELRTAFIDWARFRTTLCNDIHSASYKEKHRMGHSGLII